MNIGYDAAGTRGALCAAGLAAICGGLLALVGAMVVVERHPRSAVVALGVVIAQWTVIASAAGDAFHAALFVVAGSAIACVILVANRWGDEINVWLFAHSRLVLVVLAGVIVAMPVYLTAELLTVWEPPDRLVAWTREVLPHTVGLSVFGAVAAVWGVARRQQNPGFPVAVACAFVAPLAVAWLMPGFLDAASAAAAFAVATVWATAGVCALLVSSSFMPRSSSVA